MNFGRVGFVMEGDWSAAVTYDTLSVVLYEGAVYAAKRMSAGSEPSTHPADWMMWVGSPVISAEQTEAGYDLTISNGDGTTSVVHLLNGQITEAELTSALSGLREAFNANIAEGYSSSSVYSEGDYCLYNNVLYRCKTDILSPEAWDSTHWEAASLADDVQDLSENLYNNKADAITSTASGEIVTISDGGKDLPVVDLKVSLLPVQSGSGDPSPDNVRPISGWTGVEVYHAGENLFDGVSLEQGTINGSGQTVASDYRVRFARTMQLKAGTYKIFTKPVLYGTIRVYSTIYVPSESVTAWTLMDGYSFTLTSDRGVKLTLAYDDVEEIAIVPSDVEIVCASANGATIPISWQSSAGTVYSGSMDVTTGLLIVPTGCVDFSNLTWETRYTGTTNKTVSTSLSSVSPLYPSFADRANYLLEKYQYREYVSAVSNLSSPDSKNIGLYLYHASSSTASVTTIYLVIPVGDTPSGKWVYKTTTTQPIAEYQLSENQIATYLGVNNFWSNGNGVVDLEYRCDTKLYIEQLAKPSEDDMVANANIVSGKFFMIGNRLMLSTTAIAQGETIIPGTNCSEISLADALNQINS